MTFTAEQDERGRTAPFASLRDHRVRLALRVLAAGLVAYAVAFGLGLPQAFWAVVSALIVMQASVGATVGAGIDRVLGNVAGAVIAVALGLAGTALGFGQPLAFALTLLPVAVLAAWQPRFRGAPVTAAIILLGGSAELAPVVAGLHRVVEIFLGSVIGVLVSRFVLPARAHALLLARTAEALHILAEQTAHHLAAVLQPGEPRFIDDSNRRYHVAISAADSAAGEARRERATWLGAAPASEPLQRALRRLRSDVGMLARATVTPVPAGQQVELQAPMLTLAGNLQRLMDLAAASLVGERAAPDTSEADRAIARFLEVWEAVAAALPSRSVGVGHTPLLALPFAVETLRRDLGDLLTVVDDLAESAGALGRPAADR